MASRIKANEQGEGRSKISLSEFLDIVVRHGTCVPSTLQELEGFLRMMSIHIEKLQEAVPDYTTMWWRVVKVKVYQNPEVNLEKDIITIAVDSTGRKSDK